MRQEEIQKGQQGAEGEDSDHDPHGPRQGPAEDFGQHAHHQDERRRDAATAITDPVYSYSWKLVP